MGNDIPLYDPIEAKRDCDAILIPHGMPITVSKGTVVYVTQALGGSVTVNVNGNLARIAGKDLDALGMQPETTKAVDREVSQAEVEALVWEQLRSCYDPEIPINIVELGLVYECVVSATGPVDGRPAYRVDIRMTLTAPGCGMGDILVEDIRGKVQQIPRVGEVNVDLTFDPVWDASMMSEAARLQTGML